MRLIDKLKSDLKANDTLKARLVVFSYRMANAVAISRSRWVKLGGFPLLIFYKFFTMWLLNVEIPPKTKIGVGFSLAHGASVVINEETIIGNNVVIRQFTTIGNKGVGKKGSPIIGDDVEIGANSVLIGNIIIGDNVTIGAGTIITKSIPSDTIVYGNPMQVKLKEDKEVNFGKQKRLG